MSTKRTLSKSDYKLGTDCWTKLYYKKLGYQSANDDNEYLGFLAEGGYQDMTYGRYMSKPDRHTQISEALRRYYRLDTLAQVIIWEH